MRRLKGFLLAAVAAGSGAAYAQNDEVAFGPAPTWAEPSELLPVPADADGTVFVRRQDTLVHLDEEGQAHYINQRVKLLHPQALQAGNVAIVWNPDTGAPVVHALRIHRDGAVIDVLETTEFEILRREDQLEQAMLQGLLTAVLRVPDLRVGDELELAYTTRGEDPTLGADSSGLLFLVDSPPPGRFRLGLSWEAGQKPDIRLTTDFEALAERGAGSLDIRADNPPIKIPPQDAPPRFRWQRIIEFSDFASWSDVSRRFDPLFDEAARLADDSPVKAEAARIAAAHAGELARAEAALELVQQQVRYIFVGLNGGNLTPASADETWQRRYGDCKGKTALLLALLAELGIEAEAVLANNAGIDDGFDRRLPNPGLFDHVLVRAKIGGETYWMDGTLPVVAEAATTPFLHYRWVLPLASQGAELERVAPPELAYPDEMTLHEIDARAGFDEPARIVHTSVKRGLEGIAEYMQFSAVSHNQLETSFRQAFTGKADWDRVESVDYRYDPETRASILTIEGARLVDWDDDGDGARSLSLPGGGFSPPGRRSRPGSGADDVPYYNEPGFSCSVTTVRLPENTDPENWSYNSAFDTMLFGQAYYRAFERREGAIRMVRGSRTERSEIGGDIALATIRAFPGSTTRWPGSTTIPRNACRDSTARRKCPRPTRSTGPRPACPACRPTCSKNRLRYTTYRSVSPLGAMA